MPVTAQATQGGLSSSSPLRTLHGCEGSSGCIRLPNWLYVRLQHKCITGIQRGEVQQKEGTGVQRTNRGWLRAEGGGVHVRRSKRGVGGLGWTAASTGLRRTMVMGQPSRAPGMYVPMEETGLPRVLLTVPMLTAGGRAHINPSPHAVVRLTLIPSSMVPPRS